MKALFIVLALALTACSKHASDLSTQLNGFGLTGDEVLSTLRVTDLDGKGIANAQILIGSALDTPFVGNFLTTDANGMFAAPAAWTSPQMVTISAPGFVRASYVAQMSAGQTFQMRPLDKEKNLELKGKGTGFKVVDKDDKVDFALMMPIMKKNDLFAFDASKIVSKQTDIIEVYGQKVEMPSNISLPKQKEVYLLFTVTLDKPVYRMFFGEMGDQWVYTARGQFPFQKVVKEMQGKKQFFDLINDFSLQGGSLKQVSITGPTQNMDLPVNELIFNQPKKFVAPAYGADQTLLAVAVSPFQGAFIPTDLKNVPSKGTIQLNTATGNAPLALAVLQNTPKNNKMDGRLSVSITDFKETAPDLLPLLENPEVVNQNLVKVKALPMPGFIGSGGTYSLLSKIEQREREGVEFEVLIRVWEVYGAEWANEVVTPQWPGEAPLTGKKRWEVSYVGHAGTSLNLGPAMLEAATHATHAQTDF